MIDIFVWRVALILDSWRKTSNVTLQKTYLEKNFLAYLENLEKWHSIVGARQTGQLKGCACRLSTVLSPINSWLPESSDSTGFYIKTTIRFSPKPT